MRGISGTGDVRQVPAEDGDRIRGAVRAFLLDRFYVPVPEGLADDTSLLETGIVDSTGVQEVIGFIEQEFRIQVENDEILPENLDSVDRLSRFVGHKLQAGREASGSRPGSPSSCGT
jgi:acyl carrier protein